VPVIRIEDGTDARLAEYRNVPDPELLATANLFVAEGRLVVRRLIAGSGLPTRSVLVTDAALATVADLLVTRPVLPVYVVPQAVMNAVAGFNIHRGCLALGERPPDRGWEAVSGHAGRLLVLERVGNADNVGSLFRNAAAFGADGVLLGPACADPLYRKSIRTSMGATLTMPNARATPWPDVLHILADSGWTVLAMAPSARESPLRSALAASATDRVAVVVGHEGEGLTPGALDACSRRARIPVSAAVDSLNVATAAAIALYELAARRRET
jgi:tRNA G18 (ribose-2'-O)-methylase SpoU